MRPDLKELLEKGIDALAVVDPETFHIVEGNASFRDLLGKKTLPCSFDAFIGREVPHEKRASIAERVKRTGICLEEDEVSGTHLTFQEVRSEHGSWYLVRAVRRDILERERQFRELIEQNVAGVFQGYLEGRIVHCNLAFARMLGYESKEELMSGTAYSLYPTPAERDRFLSELKRKKVLVNYEILLRRKDGKLITCLENTYLGKTADGRELISGTIIEVTPWKEAERELQESEERFKVLSEVAKESIVFIEEGKVTDCNRQFAELFGYHNDGEILGREITDFFTPQDLKRIYAATDISPINRMEIRTFDRTGNPIITDVTGGHIQMHGRRCRVLVVNDVTSRKKTEYALEQSVLRLRNLLENSPTAILILTEGRIRYANQASLNLFGVEYEDELFDKVLLDFISSVDKEEMRDGLERIAAGDEIDYKEIHIRNMRDEELDVGIKCTLTVHENKPSIQVALNNISERMQLYQEQMRIRIIEEINAVLKKEIEEHKRTQLRLETQENYTRSLIESSLDMIIASDEKDRVSEFNKAAEREFGYQRSEILGQPIQCLYYNDDEFRRVRKVLESEGVYSGEIRNLRKNGESFTALISASRILDDSGKVLGSMGVSRDMTEFLENERKANEQKAKLESIFNSTENMVMWTMDPTFRVTTMNVNFQHWLESEFGERVHLGDDIFQLLQRHVDEDLYQGQLEAFRQAFKGRHQQFEFAMKNTEGRTIWMQSFLNPVYLDENQAEISCLLYDTTERKLIDRRVREALKEKEVLLQEIHHRVKNNLQVISSILNLQSSYVSDEQTREILQESQNRIKSMSYIHETLYRTSDFSNIDFSEYLKALAMNLVHSYRTQECEVGLQTEVADLRMHIDQAIPCGLIVNELVSNALKHAFKGKKKGLIKVELHQKKSAAQLRISDNGTGLPAGFHYEKTDSLGIQLVYTLIEQLDGTIKVDTSPKGTSFLVTFELRNNQH